MASFFKSLFSKKEAKPVAPSKPALISPARTSHFGSRIGGRISTMEEYLSEYVYSRVVVENKAGATCAIKGVRATAQIADFLAEVDLELRFANETGSPMEAVFKFLTTNEVMYAFEVKVAGKVIKGVCKEKEEARREYDDAIASGKGAYLAEENATPQRKSFDIMVGNLPDKGTCTVKISYAQELTHEDTDVIFALPVTGAFAAAATSSTSTSAGSADELNGFEFKASVQMGSKITDLGGYEELHVDKHEGNCATVSCSSAPAAGRVELRIRTEAPYDSSATIEEFPSDPKDRAIMLSLFPKVDTEVDTVTEMIFLIDRSGSMGSKILQVRNAMQLFLRCMPSNTRFNIVGFGSSFKHLFSEPVQYSEKTMNQAIEHVSSINADLGGTELYTPLSFIMKQPVDPKYPRQIFVLTDGCVSNTGLVLDYVRDNIGTSTRIFTLGIGSGASQVLVQGIAHLGHGMSRSVSNSDRLEKPIMALVKRAMTPIIVDVAPDWGDFTVLERPIERRLAPVFDGQKLIAYDFLDSKAVQPDSGKVVVKMTATTSAGEKIVFKAAVDASKVVCGNSIHRLAATSVIRDLEKAEAEAEAESSKPDKYKKEICTWALRYSVASKHTSFIAVEDRIEPTLDAMKPVDVSKQLGEEHMDIVENKRIGAPPPPVIEAMEDDAPAQAAAAPAAPARRELASFDMKEKKKKSMAPSSSSLAPSMSRARRSSEHSGPIAAASEVYSVVLLATAVGSFKLDDAFATAIKKELAKLREALPESLAKHDEIWATLLALAFMEIVCKNDKEEWELLYNKSKKFILAQLKANKIGDEFNALYEKASKIFA